jgi:hypothetical protein
MSSRTIQVEAHNQRRDTHGAGGVVALELGTVRDGLAVTSAGEGGTPKLSLPDFAEGRGGRGRLERQGPHDRRRPTDSLARAPRALGRKNPQAMYVD